MKFLLSILSMFIVFDLLLLETCKSCNNKICKNSCLSTYPTLKCSINKCTCEEMITDKLNQTVQCNNNSRQIILPNSNFEKLAHFECPKDFNIVITKFIFTKRSSEKHDITKHVQDICNMKTKCVYLYHGCKTSQFCYQTLETDYVCKEMGREQSTCDKYCFHGGNCVQCHLSRNDWAEATAKCLLCHCQHEIQVLMPNKSVENRFCEWPAGLRLPGQRGSISSAGVFGIVVGAILFCGLLFGFLFLVIYIHYWRNGQRQQYQRQVDSQLLTFSGDNDML